MSVTSCKKYLNKLGTPFYIALFFGIALLVSALLLIYLGSFSTMSLDDYNFGLEVHKIINSGSANIFDIFSAALTNVLHMRYSWQGTYFGIFLMSLNPMIFCENLGWIVTAVAIFSIFIANMLLYRFIGRQILIPSETLWLLVFASTFLNINALPSMSEGMFWWNAVSFYTLSYGLVVMYFVLWVNLPKRPIIYSVLLLLTGFMLEGNCWPCCTLSITFATFYIVFIFFLGPDNKKTIKWLYFVHYLFILSCFFFALSAPGNFIRSSVSSGAPAWLALLESPIYAFVHLIVYLSPATVLLCSVVGYFLKKNINLWQQEAKYIKSYWFAFAVLITYAAMFTPAIYGENHVAAGRYLNVLYLMHLPICLALTCFFVARYSMFISIQTSAKVKFPILLFSLCMFASGLFSNKYEDFSTLTVLLDLRNGSVMRYAQESKIRSEILHSEEKIVDLPARTIYPRLFIVDNLSDQWTNEAACLYYDKFQINIIQDE